MENLTILITSLSILAFLLFFLCILLLLLCILRMMPPRPIYRDEKGQPVGNWKSLMKTLGIDSKPTADTVLKRDKTDEELSDEEFAKKYPESITI